MQTKHDRSQEDLFVASPLRSLIPDDHVLKRVDAVLDLSWLHEAVRGCYCQDNGRPSIDPESALRLMLAGFFYNIKHDRALLRMNRWRALSSGVDWEAFLTVPEDDDAETICLATHRGRPLATDSYLAKLETKLNRRLRPLPVGRPRKSGGK